MACVKIRRGRYVLDWRDETLRRRWRTFPLTDAGLAAANRALALVQTTLPGSLDPGVTVGSYFDHWLRLVRKRGLAHGTVESYSALTLHLPPGMKALRIIEVSRPLLKAWASGLITKGFARATIARLCGTMRCLLGEAVDDGLLPHNPAIGLQRSLGFPPTRKSESVRPMDRGQLASFLAVSRMLEPKHYPKFAVLAYAGLRSGEARGLQMDDVDFVRLRLRVERQVYVHGGFGPVKNRKPREVDLGEELAEIMAVYVAARRAFDMKTGSRAPWLLYPEFEDVPSARSVRSAAKRVAASMRRVLREAGLPDHFTPHSLRHAYATILLSHGESLLYVARQLGDTLAMASETYGSYATVPPTAGGPNLMLRPKGQEREGN